ncbi:MAG: hemolysin III family protein [Armatimonadetes bacterium]|nr:hemolysin III family protein [Armatimonadota bacterium]
MAQHVHSLRRWLREPFCGISHGVGAAFSVAGLMLLLVLSKGHPWHVVSFAIYGVSLILLYTASALYHSLAVPERIADRLMRLDHCAIYLLIAGTYTPVCLLVLRGAWGWSIFGVEWGLALTGILATLLWRTAPDWFRVVLYVLMGWLIVIAFGPLRAALPAPAFWGIVAGGLTYSVGTIIFATDRPHLWPGRFSAHDLWHLFVLGGSACHFAVMARFLTPAA